MQRDLDALTGTTFDLAIAGGGITGCCIARDAARRGLRVALVERRDFSCGTSAATSKMVHGGLRYLQSFQVGVVRESLRERRLWQQVAPHLVRPLPFLVPAYDWRHDLELRLGLAMYDLLAFDRNRLGDASQHIDASRHLSRAGLLSRELILEHPRLRAGMTYGDCHVFSPERAALECLLDAAQHGAVVANYAEVAGLTRGQPHCLEVRDTLGGHTLSIRARIVINASGPWTDDVSRSLGRPDGARVVRSKGIHLFTRALTTSHALTIPVRGRHFFVIPWRGHALIGTTDTPYPGRPDDLGVSEDEIAAFLDVINAGLPAARLTRGDVVNAYAGLRPLIATGKGDSYKASRRSDVIDEGEGLFSVIGGKWTTSRAVAERMVDLVTRRLGTPARACDTGIAPLPGGTEGRIEPRRAPLTASYGELSAPAVAETLQMFGARASLVLDLARREPSLAEPVAPGGEHLAAAVVFTTREEMARTLLDVVLRRTGIGGLGPPGRATLERCAALMAGVLGWSETECARQVRDVEAYYRTVSMLPHA